MLRSPSTGVHGAWKADDIMLGVDNLDNVQNNEPLGEEEMTWADNIIHSRSKHKQFTLLPQLGITADEIGDKMDGRKASLQSKSSRLFGLFQGPETPAQYTNVVEPYTIFVDATPRSSHPSRSKEGCNRLDKAVTSQLEDLSIQSLLDNGASMEDVTIALYDVMREHAAPNFFPHMEIDHCGGLNGIERIWNPSKYASCILLYLSVAFNVAMALMNFLGTDTIMLAQQTMQHGLFTKRPTKIVTLIDELLMASGSSMAHSLVFVKDVHQKVTFLIAASVIASVEVMLVLNLFLQAGYSVFVYRRAPEEYRRYQAIERIFYSLMREAKTISALAIMSYVHPAFVTLQYEHRISHSEWSRTRMGFIAITSSFVFERIAITICVVSAFAVKLVFVTCKIISPKVSWWEGLLFVLGFLNQCMNLIRVQRVLQERVFLFVFGGSDASFQADETALLKVYRASLVRTIWLDYWVKGHRMKAISLISTLDHYDLQALLIKCTGSEVQIRTQTRHRSSSSSGSSAEKRARMKSGTRHSL